MTPRSALGHGLAELGQDVSGAAQDKLLSYLELLAKWNRTYNLTAIRDPLKMISHHVLDSLAVRPHLVDMSKAVDKGLHVEGIRLVSKQKA